jgi:anti-sigma regulatory factor (Ser/Thr protein kinase)
MRLILAHEDGLNAVSCDRLLALLASDKARAAAQITIDLTKAAFIDPYGAASLVLMVDHLNKRGHHVLCVLPDDERIQSQAGAIGLVSALRSMAEVRNLKVRNEANSPDAVLALTAIRSRTDVQLVVSYLINLAQSRLGYDLGDVLDASKIVSELCYNVVDHSGATGLVTARILSGKRGQRFIALAVVDSGVGIRASLAQRYPDAAQWPHGQAIEQALGGLSSRPAGGGVGLRSVEAVVRRHSGRLVIRSGNERLYLAADRQSRLLPGVGFAGTQVGISFSQKK